MKRVMWLLGGLAACGDGSGNRHIADAPAQQDVAALIDAAPNPVTVMVVGMNGGIANVEVYFQNADSTLVATAMTGADGIARQVMAPGGFVTVVDANPTPAGAGPAGVHQLNTWSGVKPGDLLLFSGFWQGATTNHTFTFPIDSQHGATNYEVFTNCGNQSLFTFSGPSGTGVSTVIQPVTLYGCGTTTDVMVLGRDFNNATVSWFYKAGLVLADGDSIDLSQSTYTAAIPRTFELDNNTTTDNINITDTFFRTQWVFSDNANATGLTATATIPEPALPANSLDVIQTSQIVGNTTRSTLVWGSTAANFTVDYGASLVGDFTGAPSLDTTTHTIDWTLTAGKPADFSYAYISANRNLVGQWYWSIVSPSATHVQLPTLPTDIQDFTIAATDTYNASDVIVGIAPGGYDVYRPNAFEAPPSPTGSSGTAAFNEYIPQLTVVADRAPALAKLRSYFVKEPVKPSHHAWRKR